MSYTLKEHQEKKILSADKLIESVGMVGKINPDTVKKLTESAKGKSNRKLIVQMEAIHVGRTANYTFYTEQGLRDGLESWTHPYNKPVLTHHNQYSGEPVGRILKAEYAEATPTGKKGLIFTCEITDPVAIEKVLDGRYSTVSIGATTDKVSCNICGTDRTKEWCEHWKGEEYDGQTCHYIVGTTLGREVSYVNVPADESAGNFSVNIQDPEEGTANESATLQVFQIAEGLMENANMPGVNLYESASDDIKELVNGLVMSKEGSNANMDEDPENNQTPVNEAAVQKLLTEANAQIVTLKDELAEAKSTIGTMTIEKTKIESQLTEARADVDRLTTENASLVETAHKSLAEKVVDMKTTLRKADVVGVTKEEAIEAHIKRTTESLKDAVSDLQAEMANSNAVKGTVPNPGAGGSDNNPNEQEDKKMTVEAAANTFLKMFGRK